MADVSRRALLRAFLAAPLAVRFAPAASPPVAVFSRLAAAGYEYRVFRVAAGERIEAGQMVALRADGTVYPVPAEYPWMRRFSVWDPDPTARLLANIMKGKASA